MRHKSKEITEPQFYHSNSIRQAKSIDGIFFFIHNLQATSKKLIIL